MKKTDPSTYDAIIIGTGPGGATVARELSLKGKRVLMAEAGSMPKIKGTGLQTLPVMRLKPTTDDTAVVWQVATGGATFSFSATALDPPFDLVIAIPFRQLALLRCVRGDYFVFQFY